MVNAFSIQYIPSFDDVPKANNAKPSFAVGGSDPSTFDCTSYSTKTSVMMRSAREQIAASERRSNCVIRKSCDYCGIRKKKCDGKGTRTCSFCKKGLTCIYSKKIRQNRPHRSSAEKKHGDLGMLPCEESLKRCRLSSSPATGLVGMVENAFLSTYFECMGSLPIACQSNVREVMVRILSSRFATRGTAPATGKIIHHDIQSDLGLCSFWFAVAMGGLVQGRPKEAVGACILRAKAAVDAYSKVPTPDLARVWLQMAMISAFSGDLDDFGVNVDRARSVVRDLRLRGSLEKLKPGLLEMVKHSKALQLIFGKRNNQEDLQSFIDFDIGPIPQVGNVVTLEGITQFSMHNFRHHGQALFVNALATLNKGEFEIGGAQTLLRQDIEGLLGRHLEQRTDLLPNAAVADEHHVGRKTGQLLQEFAPTYERLEDVARRSSIPSGIASLEINLPLCIMRIAQRNANGAMETASRAIEVFLSYPGLIRFEFGMHICHLFLTLLSILESTKLFEKLRVGYNNHRSCGPAIPPMEEWEGLGPYCNNFFCRTVEETFRKRFEPHIEPDLPDSEINSAAETAFPNGEGEAVSRTNRCGLKRGSDHSTMKSDDLGCDSIFGVRGTVVSEGKNGVLDPFVLGSSGNDPIKAAGPIVSLGDQVNPFERVEADELSPEDWEIAIDALLEDVTTDIA